MINPIEHVELSTHVHATESELKVVRALLNLLPPQYRDGINIMRSGGQGHFGNDIGTIKVQFKGQDALQIAQHILKAVDQLDREIILVTINSRFSDGKLYLRFNKQLAYNGVARLDDGDDVIKVIIRFNHWVIKNEGIETIIKQLMRH
ncbi:RNA-binding domain-containing protein [Vulcanisaeta distributa]|uniref:Exosome subunit n=1 Tax=Vulcanisaeta distributa (strain DSM 14429 / JCM 11212 / NBRC 100878 / IC-017) TaxID=572478 RepID=E1QTM7_VULDI|nr:RNA-binding domain-containing protein [Vulcanisaeta distributa]ADN49742.1 Protein of unknown function DUF54 [Vulcanisaeta distributa DSM 14429]